MAVLKYWDEDLGQWLPVAPGPKGDKGDKGDQGDQGVIGPTPSLSIGTVGTGAAAANLTGTSEAPVLNLTLPTPLPADGLRVWGHSYLDPAGTGPNVTSGNCIATVLGEMVGLPVRNEAIGGTTAYEDVNAGGGSVCSVLQKVTRPRRFSAPQGLHVTMWGLNDLNKLGNTADALKPTFAAYRATISRLRQGAIFENSDASVAYGGVYWEVVDSTSYNSGSSFRYGGASTGGTITITTPADFPGGTLVLGVISWSSGGGTLSGTVNDITYSINTASWPTDRNVPGVLRIPDVPAGSASYVFTVTAVAGAPGLLFDYWAWEAPDDDGPVVVIVKQPKPLDYDAYGSVSPGPPTDNGVDALNAGLDALAAEFGDRVITVDTSDIDADADYWSAGDVHPNVGGHLYIATQVRDALRDVGAFSARPTSVYSPRLDYGTAAPTGTTTRYAVGDRVVNTSPAEAGSAGSKYVITGWVCTVAGIPGTWVPLRSLTGS